MSAVSPPSPRAPVDRCPGALRPHQAADGPLVRLRLPGGQLSATAMRALAGAADLGDGQLELTSRANVQLRALTAPGAVVEVAERCADAGLLPSATHERVRNILGSPLSGRDRVGAADIRPLLRRLDADLCADPALAGLPGRFAFAVDDGRGDVVGLGADVAWRAGADRLLLAGVDCGRPGADPVPVLLGAARAFLALGGGNDGIWRVADLPDGVSRIAATLGTGSGSGTGMPVPAATTAGPPTAGRHGPACAVLAAPLGRLSAAQATLLADAADAAGGGLVVTPWRQVVVDLAGDGWLDRLVGAGLVADPGSPWVGLSACAGVGGCERARGDVRADARAFADQAAAGGPAPGGRRAVHWVGCERRCGRPAGPTLVLIATGGGYETPQGTVDAAAAHRLAAAWRSEGER